MGQHETNLFYASCIWSICAPLFSLRESCRAVQWDHWLQWDVQLASHYWRRVRGSSGERFTHPYPVHRREIHPEQPMWTHLSVQILWTIRLCNPLVTHEVPAYSLRLFWYTANRPLFKGAEIYVAAHFHRTAFCCWMLANILFCMPVILYAGYMMLATAAFIFFSMASFSTIMNVPQCVFSLGTDSFETQYSNSFWLALATGKDEKPHVHFTCFVV